jgi:hypothetical protein
MITVLGLGKSSHRHAQAIKSEIAEMGLRKKYCWRDEITAKPHAVVFFLSNRPRTGKLQRLAPHPPTRLSRERNNPA